MRNNRQGGVLNLPLTVAAACALVVSMVVLAPISHAQEASAYQAKISTVAGFNEGTPSLPNWIQSTPEEPVTVQVKESADPAYVRDMVHVQEVMPNTFYTLHSEAVEITADHQPVKTLWTREMTFTTSGFAQDGNGATVSGFVAVPAIGLDLTVVPNEHMVVFYEKLSSPHVGPHGEELTKGDTSVWNAQGTASWNHADPADIAQTIRIAGSAAPAPEASGEQPAAPEAGVEGAPAGGDDASARPAGDPTQPAADGATHMERIYGQPVEPGKGRRVIKSIPAGPLSLAAELPEAV